MEKILKSYVEKFNRDDNECYKQSIDNSHAEEWMKENIPLIDVPDKTIEEIYYFRWWVFRKHIKETEDGYMITEFLPPVRWGGTHNTIIAAAGHHLSEGKWLKNAKKYIEDYVLLWLEEKSKTYLYSSWLLYALFEYCTHINDYSFGIKNLDLLVNYYETKRCEHMTESGLFWSIDNFDAMEVSISGTNEELKRNKGIRPTLNSYMAANALAIWKFAELAEKADIARKYKAEYERLKKRITDVLWDGEFYKAIHTEDEDIDNPSVDKIPPMRNAKELIGYIPWCFNLPPKGFEKAFEELKNEDGFKCQYGLTTAEQRHPRFLYKHRPTCVCLWNGYIWPYATCQTLNAVRNVIDNYEQDVVDDGDYFEMLRTYAESQYIILEDGTKRCWIDEVKDPRTNKWSSRELLESFGWKEEEGGFERGKDYNHSTFCDNVLKGLLGIRSEKGEISVVPHIPEEWEYFAVDNLWVEGKKYKITYDRNGEKYGYGKGLKIHRGEN